MAPVGPSISGASGLLSDRAAIANASITLPVVGSLDLAALEGRDQRTNRPGLLRSALHNQVAGILARSRACTPPDMSPTVARLHLRVHSQAGGPATLLEVLDLSVQRGAPLSPATSACLLAALRSGLPRPIDGVDPALLPDFDGDATVPAALKLDPACGL